jgi:hypothetical protein
MGCKVGCHNAVVGNLLGPFSAALGFVVAGGIEVHCAKRFQDARLFAALCVFKNAEATGCLPGLAATDATNCLDRMVFHGGSGLLAIEIGTVSRTRSG